MEEAPVYLSFSQRISDGLSFLTDSLKKIELPLQNVFISAAVFGLKEVLKKLAFKCPERNYELYSLLFIFVPAVVLFCLALMISRSFWKMVSGCCLLPRSRRRSIWKRSRKYVYLCSLPPVVWFLFVFVDADYYICFKQGSLEARLNKTEPSQHSAILIDFQSTEAESQIIALLLLSVIILFATILITLDRCCTKAESAIDDDEEYNQYLAQEEIRLFNLKLEPLAKEQAKEQMEALFEKYKDVSDPAEKIRLISKQLEKDFPLETGSHI